MTQENDGESLNQVGKYVDVLKGILPETFTEDGIDFDVLRQMLGDELADTEEKYGLTWHGKKKSRQIALTPSTGTLRPRPKESIDWETTKNLFIEGDNLEVMKLLQRSYAKRIKLIYIDPPYNSGNDFVYPDKFADQLSTYLEYTGQIDGQGQKFSTNTETGGRKHTNWLSMMYPRLKLARNLLTPDGVLAISIDDNELPQLCAVCDEIFGENNRKVIAVKMSEPSGLKMGAVKKMGTVPKLKEYLVIIKLDGVHGLFFDLIPKEKWDSEYNIFVAGMTKAHKEKIDAIQRQDNVTSADIAYLDDLASRWSLKSISEQQKEEGIPADKKDSWLFENAYRICQATTSASVLKIAKEKKISCDQDLFFVPSARGEIAYFVRATFSDDVAKPRLQMIFAEDNLAVHPGDMWTDIKTTGLDGEGYVDFKNGKKPLKLLERLIAAATSSGDIVMDFFAGSGTTAEATWRVIEKRKSPLSFILTQLQEKLDPKVEGQKESYEFCIQNGLPPLVSELTKYRLRKSSEAFAQSVETHLEDCVGFKTLNLAASNIRAWNPNAADLEQSLLDHTEHLIEGRSEQDVLYELLLKRGVDLTVPIEEKEIAGKAVYSIGYGVLFACLDEVINKSEIEAIGKGISDWHKELEPSADTQVVFRDSAFADDIAKTNMTAILEQNGIAHVRSL